MPRRPGIAVVSVLRAIDRGIAYGFELIEATGFPGGTVYPALSRLERDGYLQSDWEDPDLPRTEGRPPRRYYRLTAAGRRLLEAELERLRALHAPPLKPARRRR